MKVYRVRSDRNSYQQLLPTDEAIYKTAMLRFDCMKKSETWSPPQVYVSNPNKIRGNFFGFSTGNLVFDSYAMGLLRGAFEESGEILHLPHYDEQLYVINVLSCVNCLNQEASDWAVSAQTGVRLNPPTRYSFHKNRFHEAPLFKIPETQRSEILTTADWFDEESEFKYLVDKHKLTGLIFEEIWSN